MYFVIPYNQAVHKYRIYWVLLCIIRSNFTSKAYLHLYVIRVLNIIELYNPRLTIYNVRYKQLLSNLGGVSAYTSPFLALLPPTQQQQHKICTSALRIDRPSTRYSVPTPPKFGTFILLLTQLLPNNFNRANTVLGIYLYFTWSDTLENHTITYHCWQDSD